MLTSFILFENVRTTKKRAQVLKPIVDKIITIAKANRSDLAIRRINQIVTHPNACRKVLEILKPRFEDRTSGFTRIKPAGMRGGDGALLVDLSFVEGKEVAVPVLEKSPKKQKSSRSSKNAVAIRPEKTLASSDSLASASQK